MLIPELENDDLAAALPPETVVALQDFVYAGGGLILHGAHGNAPFGANLLNTAFGFSLNEEVTAISGFGRTAAAAGTEFADDQLELPWNDGMTSLATASLPPGAISIYEDSHQSVVALMEASSGKIVYLGYDWFDAAPIGVQDGGWSQALESAVLEVATTNGFPGPHRLEIGPGQEFTDISFGGFQEYVEPSADFDEDGDIDGRDFLAWQRGYGTPALLATKSDGDSDGDGDVDGVDLAEWQESYGPGTAITGFIASDDEGPVDATSSLTAAFSGLEEELLVAQLAAPSYWLTTLVSPELRPSVAYVAESPEVDLDLVDDAFAALSVPNSWQVPDFGDIATSRNVEQGFDSVGELEEILLAAFAD